MALATAAGVKTVGTQAPGLALGHWEVPDPREGLMVSQPVSVGAARGCQSARLLPPTLARPDQPPPGGWGTA